MAPTHALPLHHDLLQPSVTRIGLRSCRRCGCLPEAKEPLQLHVVAGPVWAFCPSVNIQSSFSGLSSGFASPRGETHRHLLPVSCSSFPPAYSGATNGILSFVSSKFSYFLACAVHSMPMPVTLSLMLPVRTLHFLHSRTRSPLLGLEQRHQYRSRCFTDVRYCGPPIFERRAVQIL